MDKQQPGQRPKVKKPAENKSPRPSKDALSPKPDSPMGRFNNAMRKILSVPKKNLKDK